MTIACWVPAISAVAGVSSLAAKVSFPATVMPLRAIAYGSGVPSAVSTVSRFREMVMPHSRMFGAADPAMDTVDL